MQVYVARPEGKGWRSHQISQWSEPVEFGGNGSMGFIGIDIGQAVEVKPGVLAVSYQHRVYGSGHLYIEEESLKPLEGPYRVRKELPSSLGVLESDVPGMQSRLESDHGDSGAKGVRYLLRWESLGPNQDKRREPPYPEPSVLRLHKLVE